MPKRTSLLALAVATLVVLGTGGSVGAYPAPAPAPTNESVPATVDASNDPVSESTDSPPAELGPDTVRSIDYRSPDRIDFLEVRSTGAGEYAYRMTVRGYVQKTRANDQLKAEHNDEVRRNRDGTMTVVGTTGNGQSDAFLVRGEVVEFEKIRGASGGQLVLNGLPVSVEDLLEADIFEVVSTDEGEELRYTFTVRGTVERTRTSDDVAAGDNDQIRERDGRVTVRGVTGNQHGDAYRIEGRIVSFRRTGGDSGYVLRLDGLEVDPVSLGADPGDGDGDGDGSDVTRVGGCTVIDEPGTYRLTADVRNAPEDTCIAITASGVTFDGDGHLLDGRDGEDSTGIAVTGPRDAVLEDVTIRDVRVRDWGTGIGAGDVIEDVRVTRGLIRDVTSTSNRDTGIRLHRAQDSRIVDAEIRDNENTGIHLWELREDNVVRGSVVDGNGGYGIVAFEGGTRLLVSGNEVTRNDRGGVTTTNDDRAVTIADNRIEYNGGNGLDLDESSQITVRDNDVRFNDETGIDLQDVGADARLLDNRVHENAEHGIALEYTRGAEIRRNDVRRNGGYGVLLVQTSRISVVGNTVCDNGQPDQVHEEDSTDNRFAGNDETC